MWLAAYSIALLVNPSPRWGGFSGLKPWGRNSDISAGMVLADTPWRFLGISDMGRKLVRMPGILRRKAKKGGLPLSEKAAFRAAR
jgi:hypothetical protein